MSLSIRILEDHVVNQIAAGEVVERPASVVKELVENALDAGAKRVEVMLVNGGRDRVRVTDDGCGMVRDDALMCLERHATSKIARAEDLNGVETMGFRGEAMPSIAAVSRFVLTTRVAECDEGTRLRVEGGTLRGVQPVGSAAGTQVDVRALFFNLPARRKFLRTRQTELHHCVEAVARQALPRPDVGFEVRHEGRDALRAPPAATLQERAVAVLGATARDLFPVDLTRDGVRIVGLLGSPHVHRSTAAGSVYTFVNKRFVRDAVLRRALREAYRDLVPRGRHPIVVLDLRVGQGSVDVNVHPQKTEVRFRDPMAVGRAVTGAIREALQEHGLRRQEARRSDAVLRGTEPTLPLARGVETQRAPAVPYVPSLPVHPDDDASLPAPPARPVASAPPAHPVASAPPAHPVTSAPPSPGAAGSSLAADTPSPTTRLRGLRVLGQLHRRFVVCEAPDDGLVLVDQRRAAFHILRHRLRRALADGVVASQRLLVPARLSLPRGISERLLEGRETLSRLGVEVDAIGAVLGLRSLPADITIPDVAAFLTALAAHLPAEGDHDLVDVVARHGSRRSDSEHDGYALRALLAELDELDEEDGVQRPEGCRWEGGRPDLHLTVATLERLFDRVDREISSGE